MMLMLMRRAAGDERRPMGLLHVGVCAFMFTSRLAECSVRRVVFDLESRF